LLISEFLHNLYSFYSTIMRTMQQIGLTIASLIILSCFKLSSQPFVYQSNIILQGLWDSNASWGDYNKDGFFDLLTTGVNSSWLSDSKIYRNGGNNSFIEQTSMNLTKVFLGSNAWGDYDNDGDLDFLLTGENNNQPVTKLYQNNGNDSFLEQTSIQLPPVERGSVAWGDYDNDGDLDILLTGRSNGSSISKIYRNNGDKSFSLQAGIILVGVDEGSAAWGDYDNDGDLDILLTGWSEYNDIISRIYRNNGNNTFTEQTNINLTGIFGGSVAWGDYDNDGDLDIIMTGQTVTKIYRNEGNNSFTEQIGILLQGLSYSSAAWGDYDNDGDLDILLTGSTNGTTSGAKSKIYRNNGDNSFTEQTSLDYGIVNGSGVWGDYDNDGDLDILLIGNSNNGPICRIYRNEFQNPNVQPSIPSELQSYWDRENLIFKWNKSNDNTTPVKALNYNLRIGTSSGGNEIKSSHTLSSGKPLIPNLINPLNDTCYIIKLPLNKYYWSVQSIDKGGMTSNFAAELSTPLDSLQSRSLQAFKKTSNSLLLKWENGNGSRRLVFGRISSSSANAKPVHGKNYHAEPYLGQGDQIESTDWYCLFNGKADSTIIYGLVQGYSYDIQIVEYVEAEAGPKYFRTTGDGNPGTFSTSLFSGQTNIIINPVYHGTAVWGDYNNDGYLDFLLTGVGNSTLNTVIYRNNGNNNFVEQTNISFPGLESGSAAWGDYDNDGDLDILLTGTTGNGSSGAMSKIYRNDGGNIFTEQSSIILAAVRYSSVAWGDYDNDGDLDILLTGANTTDQNISKIYRNDGNNLFTEQSSIILSGVFKSSVAWGDYDNDGFLDILITGASGPVNSRHTQISKIYRNNGNNNFTDQFSILLTGVEESSAVWGDYDNDSDLDILLTGYGNSSYNAIVYRNDGNGFVKQTNISLEGVSGGSSIWGDYDNDGDLDILITGSSSSNLSKLYLNNGNNSFSWQNDIIIPGVSYSSAACGDYDNDGDLDLLITGYSSGGFTKIYRNSTFMKAGNYSANNKPLAPVNLSVNTQPGSVSLIWSPVNNDETPSQTMSYNVRVGKSISSSDIVTAQSDLLNGSRQIVAMGNSQVNTSFNIKKLPAGKYYWNVQAVDQAYAGSPWSELSTFEIKNVQTFFSSDEVCLGYPTNFTDQSVATSGISSWKWDFQDGTFSDLQNPLHTYSQSGLYNVKLIIKDAGGTKDSLIQAVVVKAKPLTEFTAISVCQGIPVTTTNTTNNNGLTVSSWNWEFGDIGTSTLQQPAPHPYLTAADYTIKLKAVASNGCADSVSHVVSVGTYPIAAVTSSGLLTFCKGDSVTLTVPLNTEYTYTWKSSGIPITGASLNTYTPRFTGDYTVDVLNTKGNCLTASSAVNIVAQNAPIAPLISAEGNLSFCQGDSAILSVINTSDYSYQWKLNGGAVGTNSYQYAAKASGNYSLTVTNTLGCSSNATNILDITVNPNPSLLTVNVSGPTSFCQGSSVDLSVTSAAGYTYQWENNGSAISGATASKMTANTSGVYTLRITNTSNCYIRSENVFVDVLTVPLAPTISDYTATTFCQGDSVTLSVANTSGYSYQWKLNGGAVGTNSYQYTAKSTGKYTLVVSNNNGCSVSSTNSVDVIVNPLPVISDINLVGVEKFCKGGKATLSVPANANYSYSWKRATNDLQLTTNSIDVVESGEYSVKVSLAGCNVTAAPRKIEVMEKPARPDIDYGSYVKDMCLGENPLKLSVDNEVSGYSYQWYKNGTPFSGATFIEITEGAKYHLEAIKDICASLKDSVIIEFKETLPKPDIIAKGPTVWYLSTASQANYYKWYYNGNLIPDASNSVYVAGQNLGIYRIGISNDNQCFAFSDTIRIPKGVTGIEDTDPFTGLKIYPNPTPGLFTIEMDNNFFSELVIEIFNQNGSKTLNIEFEKTSEHFKSQINLSGQSKGIYIINLAIKNYTASRKLIVE
jgi:PKD repeat protein